MKFDKLLSVIVPRCEKHVHFKLTNKRPTDTQFIDKQQTNLVTNTCLLTNNFSRFKDTLDLKYTVVYFSYKSVSCGRHNLILRLTLWGEKFILYMLTYDNLPTRIITATVPCCLSWAMLSGRSPRQFGCCPSRLSAQDKLCPRWQSAKRKIRPVWTVFKKQ